MMKILCVFIICTFFISNQASEMEPTPRTRACLVQAAELIRERVLAPCEYPIWTVMGDLRQDLSKPSTQEFAIIEKTGEPCVFFRYTDQLGQSIELCAFSQCLQKCFASHPNPNKLQELTQKAKAQLELK
jgi:hypothetical protein